MISTLYLQTKLCMRNGWLNASGVYWACSSTSSTSAKIHMSKTGGYCPGGEGKHIKVGSVDYFGNGAYKCTLKDSWEGTATVRIEDVIKEEPDEGFGFGRAEITQTNIAPGTVFNVNSNINYTLRIMNTGKQNKIYGMVGIGYHENDQVYFTGEYKNVEAEVPGGEQFIFNGNVKVLHRDYAAREMTPSGLAVYFFSGHEENGNIVWDRSEYIPIELILESGYVDPTDPDGVPEDWTEPVYDPSRPWDIIPSIPDLIPYIWDKLTPEPKEDEDVDLMPFLYIGFMGLIGYMLMRSQ